MADNKSGIAALSGWRKGMADAHEAYASGGPIGASQFPMSSTPSPIYSEALPYSHGYADGGGVEDQTAVATEFKDIGGQDAGIAALRQFVAQHPGNSLSDMVGGQLAQDSSLQGDFGIQQWTPPAANSYTPAAVPNQTTYQDQYATNRAAMPSSAGLGSYIDALNKRLLTGPTYASRTIPWQKAGDFVTPAGNGSNTGVASSVPAPTGNDITSVIEKTKTPLATDTTKSSPPVTEIDPLAGYNPNISVIDPKFTVTPAIKATTPVTDKKPSIVAEELGDTTTADEAAIANAFSNTPGSPYYTGTAADTGVPVVEATTPVTDKKSSIVAEELGDTTASTDAANEAAIADAFSNTVGSPYYTGTNTGSTYSPPPVTATTPVTDKTSSITTQDLGANYIPSTSGGSGVNYSSTSWQDAANQATSDYLQNQGLQNLTVDNSLFGGMPNPDLGGGTGSVITDKLANLTATDIVGGIGAGLGALVKAPKAGQEVAQDLFGLTDTGKANAISKFVNTNSPDWNSAISNSLGAAYPGSNQWLTDTSNEAYNPGTALDPYSDTATNYNNASTAATDAAYNALGFGGGSTAPEPVTPAPAMQDVTSTNAIDSLPSDYYDVNYQTPAPLPSISSGRLTNNSDSTVAGSNKLGPYTGAGSSAETGNAFQFYSNGLNLQGGEPLQIFDPHSPVYQTAAAAPNATTAPTAPTPTNTAAYVPSPDMSAAFIQAMGGMAPATPTPAPSGIASLPEATPQMSTPLIDPNKVAAQPTVPSPYSDNVLEGQIDYMPSAPEPMTFDPNAYMQDNSWMYGGQFAAGGGIHGGLGSTHEYKAGGRLLRGPGDGMSDSIPAVIKGPQPQRAALADGEFVIPADVVSHLGNGSTEAGSKHLYSMMDKIRHARTGNKQQGRKINPDKFLPG